MCVSRYLSQAADEKLLNNQVEPNMERTYWTNGRRSLAVACANRSLLPSVQETERDENGAGY